MNERSWLTYSVSSPWWLPVLLHMLVGVYSWVNDYDHEFTFTCPQHQTITRVVSHHDNHREDRVFDFQCSGKNEITSESCYWTEYVNDFDQPLVFQCPHGGVLDGVSSYHDNHREDRRFKFYCCEKPGMCLYNCYYSGFVNRYDADLDYTVPDGHVMRGWTSVHDNHHEDRIFDFDVCLMQQCLDVFDWMGLPYWGELLGQ
ncbi:hemagglutinin/amebocyte aggregation factor-like isoform X2 [Crassostrea virginica]